MMFFFSEFLCGNGPSCVFYKSLQNVERLGQPTQLIGRELTKTSLSFHMGNSRLDFVLANLTVSRFARIIPFALCIRVMTIKKIQCAENNISYRIVSKALKFGADSPTRGLTASNMKQTTTHID